MTPNHEFDRQLADWLHETSAHRVPDHVADVLLVTRATRQRPWWSSLERWLPVSVLERQLVPVARLPWRLFVVSALILALIAAALLFAGSQRHLPAPFGPAKNGTITFADAGDIYSLDSFGGTPRVVVGGATSDAIPSFSHDGTHLGFIRDTHVGGKGFAVMAANADGSNVSQVVDLFDIPSAGEISPDGSTLVFAGTYAGGVTATYSVPTTGSEAPRPLDLGPGELRWLGWRPPSGRELVYLQLRAGHFVFSRAAPDGSHQTVIRDIGTFGDPSFYFNPSLTPDGRSVIYPWPDGLWHNNVLDLDTGAVRQLGLGPAGRHELHGVVSPDGTNLLFHDVNPDTPGLQEMLAPLDGSAPAIPIGPVYPIVDGNANLDQEFSPDGRSIVILQGRDREIRLVDATTGGAGQVVTWQSNDLPGWQRLAP